MKKLFLVILVVLLVVIGSMYFFVNRTRVNGSTQEISLRIRGINFLGSTDWSGNHWSPVTHDFGYEDIGLLPRKKFDKELLSKLGTKSEDLTAFVKSNPDNRIYVQLIEVGGAGWYGPEFVTDDIGKLTRKTFISGRLDGGYTSSLEGDLWESASVFYPGIETSQDLVPFTDMFAVYPTNPDGITATINIDGDGDAALTGILVANKLCMAKASIDFSDDKCWRDSRIQDQGRKKYSLVFLPLLLRKINP